MLLVPQTIIGTDRQAKAAVRATIAGIDAPPMDADAFGKLVNLDEIPAVPGRGRADGPVLGIKPLPEPSIILTDAHGRTEPGNHVRVHALFSIVFDRDDYGDWLGWMLDAPWRLLSIALQGDALFKRKRFSHLMPAFLEAALNYAPQLDELGQRFEGSGDAVESYSEKGGLLHRIAMRASGSVHAASQLRAIEDHLGFPLLDR